MRFARRPRRSGHARRLLLHRRHDAAAHHVAGHHWQTKGHPAAGVLALSDRDRTTMRLGNGPHDGQPQAAALRVRSAGSGEALEHRDAPIRRDAWTAVLDGELYHPVVDAYDD